MLLLLQSFFLSFSSFLLLHTSFTAIRYIISSLLLDFTITLSVKNVVDIATSDCYFILMQIINVYNQQYESAAAFWPHVHSRIIASLLISQFLLLGLLSTKKAANSTPLLVALPILTLTFHKYCKSRFEPAFREYPLEVNH